MISTIEIEKGDIYRKLEKALLESDRYLVEEDNLLYIAGIAKDDINPATNFNGFLQWSLFYEHYRFYHDSRQDKIYYSLLTNKLPSHIELAILHILKSAMTDADKRRVVKVAEEIIGCFTGKR